MSDVRDQHAQAPPRGSARHCSCKGVRSDAAASFDSLITPRRQIQLTQASQPSRTHPPLAQTLKFDCASLPPPQAEPELPSSCLSA
eukprot:3462767-Rhodomonas_salina.1